MIWLLYDVNDQHISVAGLSELLVVISGQSRWEIMWGNQICLVAFLLSEGTSNETSTYLSNIRKAFRCLFIWF